MTKQTKRLGEILIDAGLITGFQLNTALNDQKRWGGKLGEHLVRLGFVTEGALLDALRNQLKLPTVNLLKIKIPRDIINLLPEDLIRKHKALPVGVKNISGKDHLILAMSDPNNLGALDEMQFATKLKIMPALAGPITIDRALKYYLDHQGDLFTDDPEHDPFKAEDVRSRIEESAADPSLSAKDLGEHVFPEAPLPGEISKGPPPEFKQLRAEVSAIRDLLIEKGVFDRKVFTARVMKIKR